MSNKINKKDILHEIGPFLEGYDTKLKYLVNVEASSYDNHADCIFHPPSGKKYIEKIKYEPFMYMKDLSKHIKGFKLYYGDKRLLKEKMLQYGITIKKMKTGNQDRLENGYCYKLTTKQPYNSIIKFLKDGGLDPYEKEYDLNGKVKKDHNDRPVLKNIKYFYSVKPVEQFFIYHKTRLFKGFEEYKDVHRLVFDIETTGLRPEISRVFEIGIYDNRGLDMVLDVEKIDDDESEKKIIKDLFNVIINRNPAVIGGHNSEEFDFYFILERAKILGLDLSEIKTTLNPKYKIKRLPNQTVKIGNGSEKYTATKMWGFSVIDTLHSAKKTAAINSDLKQTNLKYIAKFEKFAKDDRTYIDGEDDQISKYYYNDTIFIANERNEHYEVPNKHQNAARDLFRLQKNKDKVSNDEYVKFKRHILSKDKDFVKWLKEQQEKHSFISLKFINGKKLVEQYLRDDIWETAQVDELYNQSSFMLAKLVPTTYSRICTMGTASIWNLLLTAWSYDNDLAIPHPDKKQNFSGGLARCFKVGYTKRVAKIDYASLYPMLQLTWDIFPIFDITGVMKKMLVYMTTTRNIYKKLGKSKSLDDEEFELFSSIDHEKYIKLNDNSLSDKERELFNVKQLPIKILNNSQFGALGSDVSFNWSDNTSAARITTSGRLELRHAIAWFEQFGLIPLLAVTDGVNFQIPDKTNIRITPDGKVFTEETEDYIENMWKFDDNVGLNAIIEFFNSTEMMPPYMSVDNDGEFVSCLNLSRINYALAVDEKDKKSGEIKRKIKLTGNTIKSKTMPEYIEDFIDKGLKLILDGKGNEFVNYYYSYAQDIFYQRIPLKKIASKSKYKQKLKDYINRGEDKNGRKKAMQAHMELIIQDRERIANELFEKYKDNLDIKGDPNELSVDEKMKLVDVYMPPEPELDSTIYYINTGYRKSHGDSKMIKDKETGEKRFASKLINKSDLVNNPNMLGEYNSDKYLDAFNNRVTTILVGFDPEIAAKIPVKIVRKKIKNEFNKKVEHVELKTEILSESDLVLCNFDKDTVDESLHLSDKEVEFWNSTGYDPKLVWDGFKTYENDPIRIDFYNKNLDYLNDIMVKNGKPKIKSRNDKINKGDYVLLKKYENYSIGYNNGDFIEIIKRDVDLPKEDDEKKMDKKYHKLSSDEIERNKLREKTFPSFKLTMNDHNLNNIDSYDEFVNKWGDSGIQLIDKFIEIKSEKRELL